MLRVISIAFVALFALSACDTLSDMTSKDDAATMKTKEMKKAEMMKAEEMKAEEMKAKEMKEKEMMKKK